MNYKLRLLIASNGVQVFAATLLIPIFALFIKDIGGGPELAGILFGVGFMSTAIANVCMIRIRDRLLLDVTLYKLGLVIKIAGWTLLAFHQTIPMLVVAQVILGISSAIGSPSFNSLISENLDKKRHISEWSKWELTQNIATALASAISGFVVVGFGFGWLFSLMAVGTALALVLVLGVTKRGRSRRL
ncbi:MAG TPA: MFS transporter [Candidatus Saccharimonadales bacterium]|nr:MFS transporter [Candidatus Saccharimonadales bacterium]